MPITNYFLGCPIWGKKEWVGELFPARTPPREFLARYAELFNAVEGNSTFYGMPSASAVQRWCEQTHESFAFCFKFPRPITHDKRLRDCMDHTAAFLGALAPLGPRRGPFFVQLPPTFGPEELPVLEGFLAALPDGQYAVELRHAAFYADTEARAQLLALLGQRGVDRVLLDTRALYSVRTMDTQDPHVREALRQKPKLPLCTDVTGSRPFIRYIGHPNVEENRALLADWAERVHAWLEAGKTPYIFLHMPDDAHSPKLARLFHELLSRHRDVGTLPPWPPASPKAAQLDLFT